jgi:hypothetical protein
MCCIRVAENNKTNTAKRVSQQYLTQSGLEKNKMFVCARSSSAVANGTTQQPHPSVLVISVLITSVLGKPIIKLSMNMKTNGTNTIRCVRNASVADPGFFL